MVFFFLIYNAFHVTSFVSLVNYIKCGQIIVYLKLLHLLKVQSTLKNIFLTSD